MLDVWMKRFARRRNAASTTRQHARGARAALNPDSPRSGRWAIL